MPPSWDLLPFAKHKRSVARVRLRTQRHVARLGLAHRPSIQLAPQRQPGPFSRSHLAKSGAGAMQVPVVSPMDLLHNPPPEQYVSTPPTVPQAC
jgi:hypothetical protein